MKAYSGTGDKGETSLYGGTRVEKVDPRVEAYGAVDELNSQLGLARAHIKVKKLEQILKDIQRDLWILGGDLASELVTENVPRITREQLARVESATDELNSEVLPYINRLSSMLFVLARTANKLQRVPEEEFVREK